VRTTGPRWKSFNNFAAAKSGQIGRKVGGFLKILFQIYTFNPKELKQALVT
jgi:hypothetical protein